MGWGQYNGGWQYNAGGRQYRRVTGRLTVAQGSGCHWCWYCVRCWHSYCCCYCQGGTAGMAVTPLLPASIKHIQWTTKPQEGVRSQWLGTEPLRCS